MNLKSLMSSVVSKKKKKKEEEEEAKEGGKEKQQGDEEGGRGIIKQSQSEEGTASASASASMEKEEEQQGDEEPLPPGNIKQSQSEEGDPNFKRDLMERKKLCVVINIDNNLVDTARWCHYSRDDYDYLSEASVMSSVREGIFYFAPKLQTTTKLRPYVRTFLAKLTPYYDVVLYSRFSSEYLNIMAGALDPKEVHRKAGCVELVFENEEEAPETVGQLDAILKNREVAIVVDCRHRGWEKYPDNLVKIDPYCYFVTKARDTPNNRLPKAWIQLKGDELEEAGELYRVLKLLLVIRNLFYKTTPHEVQGIYDVRKVISFLKSKNRFYKYCHH